MSKNIGAIIKLKLEDKEFYIRTNEDNEISLVMEKERATLFPNALYCGYFASQYLREFRISELTTEEVEERG